MKKTDIQHPLEASHIQDPALAEEMAYAEKPHREDALAIDALIKRTYEYNETLDHTRPLDTGRNGGSNTSLLRSPKTTNRNAGLGLEQSRYASVNLANDAAEQARGQYLAVNPEPPTPQAEQVVTPPHAEAPMS